MIVAVTAGFPATAMQGCRGPAKGPKPVAVLKWRSDLPAGRTALPTDVAVGEAPPAALRAVAGVLKADHADLVDSAILARDVKGGALVRRSDFVRLAAATSAPADAKWSADRWKDLPVAAEATTMEADGVVDRYITTTRVAEARDIMDFARLGVEAVGSGAIATHPLIEVGLIKVEGPVEDDAAPPGSTRTYAFRQGVPGGQAIQVGYWVKSDLAAVERFYMSHLSEAGYRLGSKGPTARAGGVSLIFLKDARHYCFVRLHPVDTIEDGDGGTVKIVLIFRRPRDPAR